MNYFVRVATFAVLMLAAPMEASAGFVAGYADWKEMTEVQKRAYVRGLVDGMMVIQVGSKSSEANILGFNDCALTLKLDDQMIADAISEYYKENPKSWKYPPFGAFAETIQKGACIDYINASRRKYGLEPWTSN